MFYDLVKTFWSLYTSDMSLWPKVSERSSTHMQTMVVRGVRNSFSSKKGSAVEYISGLFKGMMTIRGNFAILEIASLVCTKP